MTREEHLQWAKLRALGYVDQGDMENAFASMASDLNKHEETRDHIGIQLGIAQKITGQLNTPEKMREFIKGFN